MKKSAFLLAGVAVLALSATTASAQAIGGFSKGQYTNNATFLGVVVPANTVNVPSGSLPSIQTAANIARANNGDAAESAWHAVGISFGNVGGDGDGSDGATFTLTGNVTEDCAFYTGTSNALAFDFGQIGVYVSDNTGPAAAFTMVAPAVMNFDTNLAGCNTPNKITIQKNDLRGLVNNMGGGYDDAVFQANLPYAVRAQYTAAAGVGTGTGALQTLNVATNADQGSAVHGAWKSNMDLQVTIPQADLALLAGDYSGNFTVTIAAN
nr:hypothetical protein [Brevundimonas naejangsanensis]